MDYRSPANLALVTQDVSSLSCLRPPAKMPYKKTVPTLRDMCFKDIVKNFNTLQTEIANLPPVLINEMYKRRHELHLNVRPLPSKLFIHSNTKELDGPFDFDLSKRGFIDNITNICKDITQLQLCGWTNMSSDNLEDLIQNIPTIIHLNLQSTQCTDFVLSEIGIHCKRLKYLNISCCRRISDIGIHALCVGTNMKIEHLDMALTPITVQGCLIAIKNLPRLRQFEFNKFHQLLKSEEFNCVNDDDDSSTEWQANSLESLPGYLKTEEHIRTAITRCPNLRQILVTALNDGLSRLCQFQRLEEIIIHRHNAQRIDFNDNIASALKNVKKLRIKRLALLYIDLVDVGVIGRLFPVIESLKLFRVNFDSDLFEENEILKTSFKRLRKLNLDFTNADVPGPVLQKLLSNCTNLESLLIYNCDTLTDELVAEVVRVNPLKSLKLVNLRSCGGIGSWGLMLLMEMKNPLRYLSICRCKNITLCEYGRLRRFARKRRLNLSISYFK